VKTIERNLIEEIRGLMSANKLRILEKEFVNAGSSGYDKQFTNGSDEQTVNENRFHANSISRPESNIMTSLNNERNIVTSFGNENNIMTSLSNESNSMITLSNGEFIKLVGNELKYFEREGECNKHITSLLNTNRKLPLQEIRKRLLQGCI